MVTKRVIGPRVAFAFCILLPRVVHADDPSADPNADPKDSAQVLPPTDPPSTGVVEVPQGLMTVTVDGEYRRVYGQHVIVPCGRHRINAGRGTRTIDVPCGGEVSATSQASTNETREASETRETHEQSNGSRGTPILLRIDGSYSVHRFFQIPLTGAEGSLGLAARLGRHVSLGGFSNVFIGNTENGLHVFMIQAGAEVEAVLGRVQLGGGASAVLAGIHRALRDDTILGLRAAFHLVAAVDIFRWNRTTLFARGVAEAALDLWGGSVGAGMSFDFGSRDP